MNIDKLLREELTKSDVKNQFQDLIKSNDLKAKVIEIVKQHIKNDKDLEKQMLEIAKNSLIQLYKTLWMKKNFWSSAIKNLPN